MRTSQTKSSLSALTRVEVAVILAAIVLVAWIVLAEWNTLKRSSSRIGCVNYLKQVALGLRMWAGENEDQFPMQVLTNSEGTRQFSGVQDCYRYIQIASNEIGSPKILVCPDDKERQPATSFENLQNVNVSYFLNLSAIATNSTQLLAGDRHLTRNGVQYTNGAYLISTQQPLAWGLKPHKNAGNIALTEGSVHQTTDRRLREAILNARIPTNWLAFP